MDKPKNKKIITAAKVSKDNRRDDKCLSFAKRNDDVNILSLKDKKRVTITSTKDGKVWLVAPESDKPILLTASPTGIKIGILENAELVSSVTFISDPQSQINERVRYEEDDAVTKSVKLKDKDGMQVSPITSASTVILENGNSVENALDATVKLSGGQTIQGNLSIDGTLTVKTIDLV